MTDLLIGLDVGTTATKALLFDPEGRVLASASRGYGLITPRSGWVEQDPEEIWRAVVETLRSLSQTCNPQDRIVALSQSSQGGTTISVDSDGRPLYPAFSWMDQRAEEEAAAVEARWGKEFIRTTTGWALFGGLPLQHIAWFRRHCPAEFAATARFLFVNDFVGYRLTGQLCMNPSDAGITQLMSLGAGDWDERLMEVAGVRRHQLSPIQPSGVPVGRLTADAAAATGLPRELLVVNGAHDQYCAAVGTGVTRPGRMLLSCGTAWVILAVPESRETGLASGMAISHHAVVGRWGAIRSLGGVGSSLEWLLDNVWGGAGMGVEREKLYGALNEAAARAPSGADGVIFLPLAGGHAAGFGPAHGGFMHVSLGHSRDHMARAVMEGTAFELRWAVDEMRSAGVAVAELTMVGGAARSSVWPQIVADVLDVPVTLPAMKDAAARGAAILAAVGAGILPDAEAGFGAWQGQEHHLHPTSERRQFLDEIYTRYQALAQTLAVHRHE
ncbi:MAG: FGGY family carbohydrate kinase [Chloroflexi bacterium]|nr:FGGY family carbohydrate kinase [Chloroflexota bacterium]